MISWSSRKQGSVAQSNIDSNYTAANTSFWEEVWLKRLLSGFFGKNIESTVIHYDNQSCIKLSENPVFHYKSKHIGMEYHYLETWSRKVQ